ncbi:hypothetical protein TIFTF001_035540 [Ficus carica]|uniref:Uncharacterized protein n=1 Tax=Ficus carica TaxID=3494 RepID=A0AA88E3I5_FICCA|nr:hypothetical protein TIFTF001_035510 [Ficus carica]GMN66450.1 hypothetical protein TIFTF001_035522 [Ficus carica]GMN66463.1 hypothetical protein TIFTF001_035528 [Ficus carica]GMN66468.1 hypothetical protein TIFTF001_035540 [Ficus carica]
MTSLPGRRSCQKTQPEIQRSIASSTKITVIRPSIAGR